MGMKRKLSWSAAVAVMKLDRDQPGAVPAAETARRQRVHEETKAREEAARREAAATAAIEVAAANRHAPTLMREAVRRARALRTADPSLSWPDAMAIGLRTTHVWADGVRAQIAAQKARDAEFVARNHARAAARRAEEAAKARAARARAKARAAVKAPAHEADKAA